MSNIIWLVDEILEKMFWKNLMSLPFWSSACWLACPSRLCVDEYCQDKQCELRILNKNLRSDHALYEHTNISVFAFKFNCFMNRRAILVHDR